MPLWKIYKRGVINMIPDYVVWIIVGIICLIALAFVIYNIVKICKMPADERKELIISFLIGLVTNAEQAYTEHGMGKEKIKEVEEAFKRTAPWFLKILLIVTSSANLNELIEKALTKVKETWGKE